MIEPLTYKNDFAEFVQKRGQGKALFIDAEMFDYWLGVLPPVHVNRTQNGETIDMRGMGGIWTNRDRQARCFSFAFAEGSEEITVFWMENGHHFCQKTNITNPA